MAFISTAYASASACNFTASASFCASYNLASASNSIERLLPSAFAMEALLSLSAFSCCLWASLVSSSTSTSVSLMKKS